LEGIETPITPVGDPKLPSAVVDFDAVRALELPRPSAVFTDSICNGEIASCEHENSVVRPAVAIGDDDIPGSSWGDVSRAAELDRCEASAWSSASSHTS
jgi:hypothetical protein